MVSPSNNEVSEKENKEASALNRFGFKKVPIRKVPAPNDPTTNTTTTSGTVLKSSDNFKVLTKNVEKPKAMNPPSMLTRARPTRRSARTTAAADEEPKSTHVARGSRSSRTKPTNTRVVSSTRTRTKASNRKTTTPPPHPVIVPEQRSSSSEEEESEIESFQQLFQKYIGSKSRQKEVEEALKARIKAGKFNLRAKADEQTSLIRRLKLLIKSMNQDQNSCIQNAELLEKKQALQADALSNELTALKSDTSVLRSQVSSLEAERNKLREDATSLSQAKEKMLNDQKDMVKKHDDDLRARQGIETEKNDLMRDLNASSLEASKLSEKIVALNNELQTECLHVKKLQEEMNTTKNSFEEKLAKRLLEQTEVHEDAIRDFHSKSTKVNGEMELLQGKLKESEASVATLKLAVSKLENEKSNLSDLLTQAQASNTELKERLQRKDGEVSSALEGLKQVQEFTKDSNRSLMEEKLRVDAKLQAAEQKVSELESARAEYSYEVQSTAAKLEALTEAKTKAENECEKYKEEAQAALAKLVEKEREASVQQELRALVESQMRELRTEQVAITAQTEAVRAESKMNLHKHQIELEASEAAVKTATSNFEKEKLDLNEMIESLKQSEVSLKTELKTLRDSQTAVRAEETEALCKSNAERELLRMQLSNLKSTGSQSLHEKNDLISELEEKLRVGDALRRKMHNTIQELRGNVRVFTRTRPFLPSDKECDNSPISCNTTDGVSMNINKGSGEEAYSFKFDKVFSPTAGQDEVFNEVSEFVQSSIDGYHVCLFSYGQTGSGKTHTMQGSGHDQMRGIIPRSIEKVLEQCNVLKAQGWEYHLQVSFLEIYNESIRDLLSAGNNDSKTKYQIKQKSVGSKELYVSDLSMHDVQTMGQIDGLMEKASRQRSVGVTEMNAQSSRSHSVFTLHITGKNDEQGITLSGKLNLVDLAGSERLSRSNATGDRMKETQAINKSLSCLADVFTALGSKSTHVPFRNSKLTYLLQSCLSNNGKTMMMVNLSPTQLSYYESLCSLRFAKQVNQCELGKAKRQVTSNEQQKRNSRSKSKSRGSSVPPTA